MKKVIAEEKTFCDAENCEDSAHYRCDECYGDFCSKHTIRVFAETSGSLSLGDNYRLCLEHFNALFASSFERLKGKAAR
jgi:predicted nucleic acid binding AN1-type Zn finger protein